MDKYDYGIDPGVLKLKDGPILYDFCNSAALDLVIKYSTFRTLTRGTLSY